MKRFVVICMLLLASGCSAINNPIDFIVPTVVPVGMEQVLDHDVPSIGRVTSVGILKVERAEMVYKMKLEVALYNIAMEQANLLIQTGEEMSNQLATMLAALGLGAGPVGFLAGSRRKRKGDLSPEEAYIKIDEAGRLDPAEYVRLKRPI